MDEILNLIESVSGDFPSYSNRMNFDYETLKTDCIRNDYIHFLAILSALKYSVLRLKIISYHNPQTRNL